MFRTIKYFYCKWMMKFWCEIYKKNNNEYAKERHQYWSVKAFDAMFIK